MSDINPYRPPVASLADVPTSELGGFIKEGRKVPIGNAVNWIVNAVKDYFGQIGSWLLITLVLFAVGIGAAIIAVILMLIPVIGQLAFQVAAYVVGPMLVGGFMYAAHRQASGDVVNVSDIFYGIQNKANPLAVVGLINLGLNFVVGIVLVVIGAIAFLVFAAGKGAFSDAGNFDALLHSGGIALVLVVIVLALAYVVALVLVFCAYAFAPALVVHNDMEATEAMKRSFSAMLRNWPATLLLFPLGLIVLLLLCSITLVGLVVVGPVIQIATYRAYRDIFYGDEPA